MEGVISYITVSVMLLGLLWAMYTWRDNKVAESIDKIAARIDLLTERFQKEFIKHEAKDNDRFEKILAEIWKIKLRHAAITGQVNGGNGTS